MKKLYSAFLFSLLLTTFVNAQAYIPLLNDSINIWRYSNNMLTVRLAPPPTAATVCNYPTYFGTSKIQYTVHDTVIDSLTYKIVREEADLNPNYCDFGYVREDTAQRKVYFRDNLGNPEILLYDFSLQVNDTFTINFFAGASNYWNGTYEVDSIVTLNTGFGTTRLFCLTLPTNNWNTMYWAEGIGCLMNAFYPYAMNQMGGGNFWQCMQTQSNVDEFITCYEHYQKVYYDSCRHATATADGCFLVTDSCNYFNICGSIQENHFNAEVNLFPAPAREVLNVSIRSSENILINFEIVDLNGKQVVDGITPLRSGTVVQTFTVNISELPPGNYILHCITSDADNGVQFVVQ